MTGVAVNDTPVNTVPVSITVTEDVASVITGISIADVDAGASNMLVTLAVPSGTVAATTGGGVTVAGSGSGTLTLTGSVASINAFIAASNVTFTTALNATAPVTLTVTTNDQGNSPAPALNDVDTVTLNVTAVNDAPTGTDATVATAEDTAYTFTLADFGFADPSDVPANALLAVRIASLPLVGSLTNNAVALNVGTSSRRPTSLPGDSSSPRSPTPTARAMRASPSRSQDNGGTAFGGVDLDASPNTIDGRRHRGERRAGEHGARLDHCDRGCGKPDHRHSVADVDAAAGNVLVTLACRRHPRRGHWRRRERRRLRLRHPDPDRLGGEHQRLHRRLERHLHHRARRRRAGDPDRDHSTTRGTAPPRR